MNRYRVTVVIIALMLPAVPASAGPPGTELIDNRQGQAVRPEQVAMTTQRIEQLQMPEGFVINVFADGLGQPRMLAVAPGGTVYVTRRKPGDVLALRDTDDDGTADTVRTAVSNIPQVHGIAIHDGRMFLANVHDVYVAEMQAGGVGAPDRIISGLPPGGRHPNRTLAVGPDNKLYITVGSTCNACLEQDQRSASVLQADMDGSQLTIFASGLRNTLGIGWHTQTGELWGMDNGTDWLGNTKPPEELNKLIKGRHYGWPFAYGDNQLMELKNPPQPFDPQAWLAKSTPSVLGYEAHSAPLQLAFYTATQFPTEYRNNAFVCLHGSWNRRPPVGYEIVRVQFDEQGKPTEIRPFLTGFLLPPSQGEEGWTYFGRPAGVAVAADGALLFSDDENGTIYRIAYVSRE